MIYAIATHFSAKIDTLKSNISSQLANRFPNIFPDLPSNKPFIHNFPDVSPDEVAKLLSSLPPKSCALDFIPTTLIKSCSGVFAELIAKLANLSFAQGSFPSCFKHASVTPLLKKPNLDPALPSNYRPISNLNNVSKIVEKLFLSRLLPLVTASPNFNPFQSAYRQFHSTETSLIHLLDSIYHAADNGLATFLLALDLSAAFDTIDHSILLNRLKTSFGISGSIHSWLSSYLTDRSFSVNLGPFTSSSHSIHCGVPQGSVLGPILFSLYISPIASLTSSHSVSQQQYADDTQLFISLSPATLDTSLANLQSCLSSLRDWFLRNGLALNSDKTEAIILGTRGRLKSLNHLTSIQVADSVIELSDHVKLLGVIFDPTLNFNKHVSNICSSSYYHIRALRRIRPFIDNNTAKSFASSIVGSRLDYANGTLYGMSLHNFHRLQRVQNSLARVVTGDRFTHSSALLNSLHWLPIRQRISFKLATIAHRSVNCTAPDYLNTLITHYTPSRQLRSSNQHLLSVPRSHTTFGSRGFRVSAPRLWNSLPESLRSLDSYPSFRSHLKTHLFPKIGP